MVFIYNDNFAYRRNQFYLTKPKWYTVFEPDAAALSGVGDAAIEVGNILADIFGEEINSDILPDGKMYYNIAKRLIEPSLKADHEIISTYTAGVQTMLNEQAGISLQGIEVLKTTDIIIFGIFLCLINQVISVIIKSVRLNFKSSQSKWRNDEEVFRLNSIYSQEVF